MQENKNTAAPDNKTTIEQNPVRTEKDPDELVHEQTPATPEVTDNKDIDELVHEQPPTTAPDPMQEIDPDDVIHSTGNDPDLEVGGES